jgi:trigger factor
MKKRLLSLLLTAAMLLSLAACQDGDKADDENSGPDVTDGEKDDEGETPLPFYSNNIDERGFWGVDALKYVQLFNYEALEIPHDVHFVSEGEITVEMIQFLQNARLPAPDETQITDRPVQDGDKVNIDFVGSIDGVEFEGGNSGGDGSYVVAGTGQFIDDFLWQIIGHYPGETIDVYVSFPVPYRNNEALAGKEALFVTTINHISVIEDDYIAEHLYESHELSTVAEFRDFVHGLSHREIQKKQIQEYVLEFLFEEVDVTIPDYFMAMIIEQSLDSLRLEAQSYNMDFDEFLGLQFGVDGINGMLEEYKEMHNRHAKTQLVMQAIIEDKNMTITEEEVFEFLIDFGIPEDELDDVAEIYGMPFLYQTALHHLILYYIVDNAVLLEANTGEAE